MKPLHFIYIFFSILLLNQCSFNRAENETAPLNTVEINYIINNMTFDEKIHCLQNNTPNIINGIERFNLPDLLISDGQSTIPLIDSMVTYPAPIAWASSWNDILVNELAKQYAKLCHKNNISILRSPFFNIYRVPFVGSNYNGFGEDQYLAERLMDNYVTQLQTDHVAVALQGLITRHQEELRDLNNIYIDNQTLHEVYLKHFYKIFEHHPPAMLHLNDQKINEHITSRDESFIQDVLFDLYNFPGILYTEHSNSNKQSILSGVHLNIGQPQIYQADSVQSLILQHQISIPRIDDRIYKVLQVFNGLELYTHNLIKEKAPSTKQQLGLAEKIATESIVLLKNASSVLPLKSGNIKKLAYLDLNDFEHAATPDVSSDQGSNVKNNTFKTLQQNALDAGIQFTKINFNKSFETLVNETPLSDDVDIKFYREANFAEKPIHTINQKHLDIVIPDTVDSDKNWAVIESKFKVPVSGEYQIILQTPYSGSLYLDNDLVLISESSTASKLINETYYFKANKTYRIKLIQAYTKPGNLRMALYQSDRAKTKDVVQELKKFDAVFVTAGFNQFNEGIGMDRSFHLPGDQKQIINEIGQLDNKLIVSITSGGAVESKSWLSNCDALLYTFYLGDVGYKAIGNILFGKQSPSGKLPFSIPVSWNEAPCYYSFDTTFIGLNLEEKTLLRSKYDQINTDYTEGIYTGYKHFDRNNIEPLFAFGEGLSYSTFKFTDLTLSNKIIQRDQYLTIKFKIKNTGNFDAAEVAQLYIQDIKSGIERPIKELKNYRKVFIPKGETKEVQFKLTPEDLSFYHPEKNKWIIEPGEYVILIGNSSKSIRLIDKFSIQ